MRLGLRDMLGLSAVTREPVSTTAVAVTDATVIIFPTALLDELVGTRPTLSREIGRALDNISRQAREAADEAGLTASLSRIVA